MSVMPLNNLAKRAVRVFVLNCGDNHASCTVKVINAATERASYTNSVVWTTSPSGGGQGGVASPPATAAPPTQRSISFEVVPSPAPAPAAAAAPPAASRSSPLPSPAPAPAATAAPPAAARSSPLPPPNASPSPGFATPPHALLEKKQHPERPLRFSEHLLGRRMPGVGERSRLVELLCRVFRPLGPAPVAAGVHAFDARKTLGPQTAESRTA